MWGQAGIVEVVCTKISHPFSKGQRRTESGAKRVQYYLLVTF